LQRAPGAGRTSPYMPVVHLFGFQAVEKDEPDAAVAAKESRKIIDDDGRRLNAGIQAAAPLATPYHIPHRHAAGYQAAAAPGVRQIGADAEQTRMMVQNWLRGWA